MNNKPLVSVIIPNYKRVIELKRSIISVINQSYKNLEILVIDDCSPNINKIKELINSLKDIRIVLIKQKENKGGGAARNRGILTAKGKYIAFLDSDDTLDEENINQKVKIAENFKKDFLIYNKIDIRGPYKNPILPKRAINDNELVSEYIFMNGGIIQSSAIFLNTSLAIKCLFEEAFPRHQDLDFIFKVEKNNAQFIFIEQILTTVYWTKAPNPIKKGWSPEFATFFLKTYKTQMTEESYIHGYFKLVIQGTGQFVSKSKSLSLFWQNKKQYLQYISKKRLIKYFIALIFDWRYILQSRGDLPLKN